MLKTKLQRKGSKQQAVETKSCFGSKFEHYIRLSNSERKLITKLERQNTVFRRGSVVWRQDEEADSLYVVQSGWMYGYSILPDGRRQILDIYCPGDVLGLRDIVFDYSVSTVAAIVDANLCPFPKSAMDDMFMESPRLATLLYSLGMLENRIVIDRLKMASRLDARELLCYFLLQIHSRLKVTNPDMTQEFHLPMTQNEIGDTLGLTTVHINRMMRRLEEEKLISRSDSGIELLDMNAMKIMDLSRINSGFLARLGNFSFEGERCFSS